MLYRALVSFSGLISMAMGEIREITDESIAKDLLEAGHIEEMVASNKTADPEKKPETKKRKSGGKKNES